MALQKRLFITNTKWKYLYTAELILAEVFVASQPLLATTTGDNVVKNINNLDASSPQEINEAEALLVKVSASKAQPQSINRIEFRGKPKTSFFAEKSTLREIDTQRIVKVVQKNAVARSSINLNYSKQQYPMKVAQSNPSPENRPNDTVSAHISSLDSQKTQKITNDFETASVLEKKSIDAEKTDVKKVQDNSLLTIQDSEILKNSVPSKEHLPVEIDLQNSLISKKSNTVNEESPSTPSKFDEGSLVFFDHLQKLPTLEATTKDSQELSLEKNRSNVSPVEAETDINIAQQREPRDPTIQLKPEILEIPEVPNPQDFENLPPKIDWQTSVTQGISDSAQRYPYIIDPTDHITFQPQAFQPSRFKDYSTSNFRFAKNNPIINLFTYAHFPEDQQFFWIVDNNKIVIETEGTQAGIIYQGRSTRTIGTVTSLLQQRFFGVQAIISSPQSLSELVGKAGQFANVTAIAGSVITPDGIPAGTVTINSGVDPNAANVTRIDNLIPIVGNPSTGSTSSPTGGGALFTNLDAKNAPEILQGFPTNDLRPLINNIDFKLGTLIPNANLTAAGIGFADPFTNLGFNFAAPITSIPGLQVAQPGGGMSDGLLNISINPFLSQRERDVAYLDSIYWFPLGQTSEKLNVGNPILQNEALLPGDRRNLGENSLKTEVNDWYRLYFTTSHKRTAVEFDSELPKSKYSSLFSAPGISFNTSFENADGVHFLNSTLGLAIGYIFDEVNRKEIDDPLKKAHQEFEAGKPFSSLKIAATDEEQRELNQRLNQNLLNSSRFSELEQLSGDSSGGDIELKNSNLTHIRTGLYQRRVEFVHGGPDAFERSFGTTFFSQVDTSKDDFGNLVFQGLLVPLDKTNIKRDNQASAAEVIFTTPDDKKIIANYDSTTYPVIGGKAADIAFDNIEISRIFNGRFDVGNYLGTLSLPSIEFLHTGTKNNFNYGVSLGTWFNLDPTIAGSIHNNIGLIEPSIGAYLRTSANFLLQDIQFDENRNFISATTQVPFFDLNWNSETNRLNTFRTQLGYSLSHQDRVKSYSITTALSYSPNGINNVIPENSNGALIGLINGRLDLKSGLSFVSNFELGKKVFVDLEATQKVFDNFKAGLYYKNSTTNNIGLDSRINVPSYGFVLKYNDVKDGISVNAKIGHSDNGFDAQLESVVSFNF